MLTGHISLILAHTNDLNKSLTLFILCNTVSVKAVVHFKKTCADNLLTPMSSKMFS